MGAYRNICSHFYYVNNMATTEQKPNLYSLYNKQYDFDEFQRAADSGVSEYISSLKEEIEMPNSLCRHIQT